MKKVIKHSGLLLVFAGVLIIIIYHLCGTNDVSAPVLTVAPACVAAGIIVQLRIEKKRSRY